MKDSRWRHVVLYKTNPKNLASAVKIANRAEQDLRPIADELPGTFFDACVVPPPLRVEGNSECQAMLIFVFKDEEAYKSYMKHPLHLQFARFVLRGWVLTGDLEGGAGERFIDYFLNAPPDSPPQARMRNPFVAEEDVVWAGEITIDGYER